MPFIALIQDLLSLLTRMATSAIHSLSCILFRVLPCFKLEALINLPFEKSNCRALAISPTQIFQNTETFLFSCHKGYAISIRLANSECFESFKYLFKTEYSKSEVSFSYCELCDTNLENLKSDCRQ